MFANGPFRAATQVTMRPSPSAWAGRIGLSGREKHARQSHRHGTFVALFKPSSAAKRRLHEAAGWLVGRPRLRPFHYLFWNESRPAEKGVGTVRNYK